MQKHSYKKILFLLGCISLFFSYSSFVKAATFSEQVVSDGAVAHWNFEESSGSLLDRIGSNNGTLLNSPTVQQTAQVGKGYDFTTNQGVNLPNSAFNSQTTGAIEAIVKFDSASGQYAIFALGDSASSNNQVYLAIDSSKIKLQVRTDSGGANSIQGNTTLTPGTFYHVVGQVGINGMQLFVNGVEDTPYTVQTGSASTTSWYSNIAAQASTEKYAIGYLNRLSPTIFYDGIIDEVALYGSVKSASVWQSHYTAAFGSSASVHISSPTTYQTFQRNTSDLANIPITGTYTGTPTAIEASFNGGPYSTIVASPSGGTFSGTLSNQAAGQGTLTVRFTNDTSITASTTYVGIGDIFIIAGQSNASGRGTNAQNFGSGTIKATKFNEGGAWAQANDPISTDTSAGSVWPLLAKLIMDNEHIPVGFVVKTLGGTGLLSPNDNWAKGGTDTPHLYDDLITQVNSSGINGAKAVLWWQGEREASAGLSRSAYNAALDTLVANFKADVPGSPKTMIAQIGEQATPATETTINDIRLAQADAWSDNTDALPGPIFYDLNLTDDLHLHSDAQMQIGANRWWAAISKSFYSGSDGRGPILSSAEYNADKTQVTLTFIDDSLPLLPTSGIGSIKVYDDGVSKTISSITRSSTNKILITLSSAASGVITVSLGSGNYGAGATVVTDSSAFNLPAEIFINYPVSPADVTAPVISSILATSLSTTGGTISWSTDESSDSEVVYGTTTAYGLNSSQDVNLLTSHSVILSGLSGGTTYHYKVVSTDLFGNTATSSDQTFTTSDVVVPTPTPTPAAAAHVSSGRGYLPGYGPRTMFTIPLVPPQPIPSFTHDLEYGMTDPEIEQLQHYLNTHGFTVSVNGAGSLGMETTFFGPLTRTALSKFQKAKGIFPSVGYFGPITRAYIFGHL